MHIFSVKDLFDTIKITLEDSFPFIMVKGSISRIKHSSTGHMFFELKDDEASISCVCWKEKINKLTTMPEENKEVTIKGYITAFKSGTRLNLVVIDVEIHGIAEILADIERRKTKLEALGYFKSELKKEIPLFPKKIGIITSSSGAVIEDIKNRIKNRYPTKLILFNTSVQGETMVKEIIKAIRYFNNLNKNQKPDVLIIARGGGSFEDLIYFNDEQLVTEVYKSTIPIVSAIGHETDTTLIDFASDLRASTPTAAAELVTPILKKDLVEKLNQLTYNLSTFSLKQINFYKNNIINLENRLPNLKEYINSKINNIKYINKIVDLLLPKIYENKLNKLKHLLYNIENPNKIVKSYKLNIEQTFYNIKQQVLSRINNKKKDAESYSQILKTLSYENTLKRGFSIIKDSNNNLIKRAKNFKSNTNFKITFYDKTININKE